MEMQSLSLQRQKTSQAPQISYKMLAHLHKTIENGFSLVKESPECFSDTVPDDNKVEVMSMFMKLVDHV